MPHSDGAGRRWPKVSGILWKVLDSGDRIKSGGPDNDELLGHHGDEKLIGGAGDDILWGDWDPRNNTTKQRDTLSGAGDDWLYPSHGTSVVRGGAGRDYVWAYYGKGTIDCGPGKDDVARIRQTGAFTTRNCETIQHFCAFGSDGRGGCRKPGEKRRVARGS